MELTVSSVIVKKIQHQHCDPKGSYNSRNKKWKLFLKTSYLREDEVESFTPLQLILTQTNK